MYTRRDLALFTIAGLAAPLFAGFKGMAAGNGGSAVAAGARVRLGVQTSSFRDLPLDPGHDAIDTLIQAMTECGVSECELAAPTVEPAYGGHASRHLAAMSSMSPQMMRRELRKWRLRTPLSHFHAIASRFDQAGVAVCAYDYSPDSTFSDEEIDRSFSMAKALGAQVLTASPTLEMAKRLAPFAATHKMVVALSPWMRTDHPHAASNRADVGALLDLSPHFKVNVDLGQFTADHVDPVAYIRDHHDEIASVRLTDARKNGGDPVAWGAGDTPIREVLQLLQREGWPIRAYVDYQYRGEGTPVEEVKRCFAYAKQALA